jgi:YVTN family beta-propeller protein
MHPSTTLARFLILTLLAFLPPLQGAGALPEGMGQKVTTLEIDAVRLAADPVRPRVYALTRNNELKVINTLNQKVIATLPVGSSPQRLAVSPDGARLFVVNSGSTAKGLAIIDLQTLTLIEHRATPHLCYGVAAASSTHVFLSAAGIEDLLEIDLTAGTSKFFDSAEVGGVEPAAHLALSPDGKTLVVGDNSGNTLFRFDTTTSPPTASESNHNAGDNGQDVIFSHGGTSFVYPCGAGNGAGYSIALFDTSDLTNIFGTFDVGAYPHNGAFSIDDRFFFASPYEPVVQVWDTETFALAGTFPVDNYDTEQLLCDSTGVYLFVVEATGVYSDDPRQIGIYTTGVKPYKELAGDYTAVPPVATTDGFPIAQVKVTGGGGISGKMRDRGRTYSFKGSLLSAPRIDFTFARPNGLPPLVLRFGTMDSPEDKKLFCTLNPDGSATDLTLLSRQAFTKSQPAPQAGRYTVHLPADDAEALGLGAGYAALVVGKSGSVKGSGVLGDGTSFAFGSNVSVGDYVAMNAALYRKHGAVAGLLKFRDVTNVSDLDGIVSWICPPSSRPLNPSGFSITRSWQAARYVTPAPSTNIFAFTVGELSLEADHLSGTTSVVANIGSNNSVTPEANNIALEASLAAKTGVFRGRFTLTGETKPTNWRGVAQTKRQRAEALFKSASGFGTVTLK